MKSTPNYVMLGMALLLSSSLFINSGWTDEHDIISFVSRNNANFGLYLTSIQGELLHRITFNTAHMYGHTWAPDGRFFAYVSNEDENNEIYVMDIKKKERHRLTHHPSGDSQPAWAPNGKWIAFISNRQGDDDIYKMDANAENVMKLTNLSECNRPAWSPDSQWIAFTASAPEGVGSSLFIMSAEGRKLRQIAARIPFPGCSWSPDGKQIAFISQDAEGGMEIFSIDVDGRNLRQLTWLDQRVFVFTPMWSPSGKWIAYILAQMPEGLGPIPINLIFLNSVVCIVNAADGGQGEPLEATRGLVTGNSLEWIPDGFFSVSPSSEKRTTLWGRLKQSHK